MRSVGGVQEVVYDEDEDRRLEAVADIILIHGTTQSPRGWDRLIAALASRNHTSHPVDLSSSATLDVEGYAVLVQSQVPETVSDPIVVAHSGAGLLLPAAARLLGARRQVWVGAVIPDGQHSLREEVMAAASEMFNEEWLGKDPTTDPVLAAYFLFHDCDPATLQWALTTVRRFVPELPYQQAVPLAPEIPSTYVVCAQDRTLRASWCRRAAKERLSADVIEIDAGHCPHVSRPEELADAIGALI